MMRPKARSSGLIVQELDDEVLVYDTERATAHCLNRTAGLVWRWSDGETSVAEMAERLRRTLSLATEDPAIVLDALHRLQKARLLEETPDRPAHAASRSRRDALRLAGASFLPLVTTIVAPHAAEAATCIAQGQVCTTSAQCCPNNQNVRCCRNGRCAPGMGNCS